MFWKCKKFINKKGEEDQIDKCIEILMKYSTKLKEIYLNIISSGTFPSVSMFDIQNFVQKSKIIEGTFALTDVNRLFIGANF